MSKTFLQTGDMALCVRENEIVNLTVGKRYAIRRMTNDGLVFSVTCDDGRERTFESDFFSTCRFQKNDILICENVTTVCGIVIGWEYIVESSRIVNRANGDDLYEVFVEEAKSGAICGWYAGSMFSLNSMAPLSNPEPSPPIPAYPPASEPEVKYDFREGDRILCVDDSHSVGKTSSCNVRLTSGMRYLVVVGPGMDYKAVSVIDDSGSQCTYDCSRFSVARFCPGDKIECIDSVFSENDPWLTMSRNYVVGRTRTIDGMDINSEMVSVRMTGRMSSVDVREYHEYPASVFHLLECFDSNTIKHPKPRGFRADVPGAFWMVKGNGPTQYHHASEISARIEAQRLANEHHGELFMVLGPVASYKYSGLETAEYFVEDIPF